jgi:uncharacterized protein
MTRRRLAFAAVAAVLVVLFGGRWLALRYTEYLWFDDLQQGPRWARLLLRGLCWRAAVFGVTLLWYAANLLAVYRSIGSVQLPRRLGNLEIAEAVPPRLLRTIAIGTAAALAFASAWTFGDLDHYVALWRHAAPIGLADPVLRRDASYYLATLPLLEVLHLLLSLTAVFGFVLVITLYAATGSLTIVNRRPRITPHARTHLVVLMAVLAVAAAIGFRLDSAELVGGGGSLNGALSTVDRGVRLPVSDALAVLALAVAVGTMFAMRWSRTTPLVALWATLGLAALLGRWLVPVIAESWGRPDPALARALADYADDYTRDAFGLVGAEQRSLATGGATPDPRAGAVLAGVVPWSGEPRLLESALRGATGDTLGVRLWSTAVIRPAGQELERPVLLAVPQLDLFESAVRGQRFDWRELHRGAMAWGGELVGADAELRAGPLRFVSSLAAPDLLEAPAPVLAPERIRIVAGDAGIGVVGPDESSVGRSAPGVLLAGPLRRLLLAWALQSPPLLDDHTSPADRVLYWRDVAGRLGRLYPFALFDPARPAVLDDRLVWVADGYLASSRFPMALRVRWGGDEVNYLAAAYLAVVDAATGATRLFERPDAGAFARSVARSEGVSPLPADSLPRTLTRQLGYPAGLFGAQAAVLALLGGGPDDNGWTLVIGDSAAARRDAARLLPTQALLPLGDEPPALWSLAPLNDGAGTRLRAIAAGSSQPGGHLRFVTLRVGGEPQPTPQAAAARIAVSPAVAAVTTLGGPEGSRRGPVHVVPVPGGVAYVQVLFTAMPGAHGFVPAAVAVAAAGRVGVGSDAASAVAALERGDGDAASPQSQAALAQARAAFAALDSALRTGDWMAIGRAWEALRRALGARP